MLDVVQVAQPRAFGIPPTMKKKNVRFLDFASQTLINNTTVPKSRRPKFEVLLKVGESFNGCMISIANQIQRSRI